MSVVATFEFDSAEHYQASRAVARQTPARYFAWGFGALALGMMAWNILPHWGSASPTALLVSALPWLLLGIFWVSLLPVTQRLNARKVPKHDPSVIGPQERVVDATGFHTRGNGVSLDVPWHAMVRGTETDAFFLFFYNKQCAYYVPKRALSVAQVADMRALIRDGLGAKAQLVAD